MAKKQQSMFDDLEGTPLRNEMNPFDPSFPHLKDVVEKISDGPARQITVIKGSSLGPTEFIHTNKEKTIFNGFLVGHKQVILGNVPSKSNCYKIITFRSKDPEKPSHASLGKTSALLKYEKDFFIQANQYRNLNIDEYFTFEIDVYYPSQRSDLDNSLKVVLDCLQKIGAIKNDNKCTQIIANKFLDKNNPRIEFIIKKSMQS